MKRRTPSHANQTIVGVIPTRGNFFTVAHFADFNLWNNPPNGTGNPFIIDSGVYLQYTSIANSAASGLALTTNTGTNWNSILQPNSTTRLTIQNSPAHWPQVSGTAAHPVIYQAVSKPVMTSNGYPNFGLIRIDIDIGARTGTVTPADVSGLGSLGIYYMGQGTFVGPVVWGVDPNDSSHLIAADVTDGQMKVSRDAGATWMPDPVLTALVTESGQTPFSFPPGGYTPSGVGLQVHAIAFDPDTPGRILVGTEAAGIFQSTDNGQTWSKIPFSDYFIRGMTSFFFADRATVFVSTYGNGLWRIDPGSFPPPMLCGRTRTDCRIDLRDQVGEALYPGPKYVCPHAPDIPECQVIGVDGGVIEDLELDDKGSIKRGAISGKGLLAYRWNGKKISPDIGGIQFSKSDRPGRFNGCPACRGVLAEHGTIRGIVQEKGKVLAIIAEFGKPPLLSAQATSEWPSSSLSNQAGTGRTLPYLQLVGTIPVTGQVDVSPGDTVRVYGTGFCGSPTCSPVTLRIGTRVVTDNVRVDTKGSFRASFVVQESPGQYRVIASQVSATKTRIEDAKYLNVPIIDKGERE
jgi:hypothetical protein